MRLDVGLDFLELPAADLRVHSELGRVGLLSLLPGLVGEVRLRPSLERRLEGLEAGLPAGGGVRALLTVEGVGEDQQGAVPVRGELEAQRLVAPGVGEEAGRIALEHLAALGRGFALPEGEAELGPRRGQLALDVRREPGGELLPVGECTPDALGRMPEPALEADGVAAIDLHQCPVGVCAPLASHSVLLLQVSFEGVETVRPEAPVRLEPLIDLGQGLGSDAVDAALGVGADGDEAGVPQHPEVLGDSGLAQLQALPQLPHRALPRQQQIQDPPSGGLGEDLEGGRGHGAQYNRKAICQTRYRGWPRRRCDGGHLGRASVWLWSRAMMMSGDEARSGPDPIGAARHAAEAAGERLGQARADAGERFGQARADAGERLGAARDAASRGASAARARAEAAAHAIPKPRLRGVSHQWAFFVSLLAGTVLVIFAPDGEATFAASIYAVSLSALLGVSALYHRVNWRPPARRWMRRLDHTMIFLLIAGTYTPFALLVLNGPLANALLIAVWAGAVAGIVVEMIWVEAPKWVSTIVYLAVGWVGLLGFPAIVVAAGVGAGALIAAGGVLYTAGALVYARQRPDPKPAVFGYHEIFHALVLAAAAAHFAAIAIYALPSG